MVAPATDSPPGVEWSTASTFTECPAVSREGATRSSFAWVASALPARARTAAPITTERIMALNTFFIGLHLLPAPARLPMGAVRPPARFPRLFGLPPPPPQQ